MTKLLNEKELSKILNVSVHFLQKKRRTGGLIPFRKIGSAVRYLRSDLENYLTQQRYDSTSEYSGGGND